MNTDRLRTALTVLAILAVVYVWGDCRESAGASKQRLRDSTTVVNAHSHQTDLRVSRLAAESLELGARLMRSEQIVTRLKRQVPRAQPDTTGGSSESGVPPSAQSSSGCAGAPSACDSIIVQQDSQLTIWKALAVERGELLQRALSERNSFRDIARAWQGKAGKRFGCAGGPAVVASISGHVSAGVGVTCGIRF